MVLLLLKYVKPLDEVERLMPEHRAFLDRFYRAGKLVFSGPREPRIGGQLVSEVGGDTFLDGSIGGRAGLLRYGGFGRVVVAGTGPGSAP